MIKTGRNELCDCGSGKKYKACHGRLEKGANQQWKIIGAIGVVFLLFYFILSEPEKIIPANVAPLQPIPRAIGSNGSQQPPGEALPGKVWSTEHGHWHDINPNETPTPPPVSIPPTNNSLRQQPPGEVPPGKVWSPEHGHWHDIQ